MITLVLSDVLGDPLDIIACGPTVPDMSTRSDSLRVIEKLGASHDIPTSVLKYLKSSEGLSEGTEEFPHVQNIVIGNNKVATEAAASMAEKLGYHTLVYSTNVSGEARDVGKLFANLGGSIQETNERSSPVCDSKLDDVISKLRLVKSELICILGAGETTVTVKGRGLGGRNQELALAAAVEMSKNLTNRNVLLLSAGTDGQDGPTPAAGAYAFPQLISVASSQNLEPLVFLNNNDSFTFYNQLDKGQYLLKTGLTGTNVMDLQILLSSSAPED